MKEMLNLSLRLALICGVASLLLSQVAAFTAEPIARAMHRAKMEAVEAVLPLFDNAPDADRVDLGEAEALTEYYRGYAGEALSGVAFKAVTYQGYSGEIELMLGVDEGGKVSGVRILKHAETPGLGAKYAAPEVLDEFYAGRGLGDTDWRVAKDGGDLDAVTGATVTGRALGQAIDEGLKAFAEDREAIAAAERAPEIIEEETTP
jgi:Na+-translocating ferredoxin:NAD+ oxidoreductase subunit G